MLKDTYTETETVVDDDGDDDIFWFLLYILQFIDICLMTSLLYLSSLENPGWKLECKN